MNKTLTKAISFAALLLGIILTITGCNKGTAPAPGTIPELTTNDVFIDAVGTSAHSGGLITSNLNSSITAYGVCWSSSNQTPSIADSKTSDTVNLLSFTSKITGLANKTTYYLRAYATNGIGTGYGNVITFTTSADLSAAAGTVSTFAGNASPSLVDGTGTGASFSGPQGLAMDASGNIYVADSFNSAIRKITPAGVVTTIAGDGTIGYMNGPIAGAKFYAPEGLVLDAAGNIYVADRGNNMIRKISASGIVSTFAGSGDAGYADGSGSSATFNSPADLVFDSQGNLYVADSGNSLIRKITPAGIVTTIAGNRTPGYLDNSTATSAQFNRPSSLTLDAQGNIYVADVLNYAIRKITPAGVVSTYLGGPKQTTVIGIPSSIRFDTKGDLFVCDQNGRLLEITAGKVLLSIAGNLGTPGFADGQGASAVFNSLQGVVTDASGNVWVSDSNNNRIRKVVPPSGI